MYKSINNINQFIAIYSYAKVYSLPKYPPNFSFDSN